MLKHLVFGLSLLTAAPLALANDDTGYPSKVVRVIVPYPAGGSLDFVARVVSEKLSTSLNQRFIVENKPGANTNIGTDTVAKARPDGYTLLFGASTLALSPALGVNLPYDLERDLAPISMVASIPIVFLVHPSSPYKSLRGVLEAAKATTKGFDYGVAGVGSMPHLIAEALRLRTGANLVRVPYKGSPPAMQDALAGRLDLLIDGYIPSGIHAREGGGLRALAVASRKRLPLLPDVPTVVELGYADAQGSAYFGLLTPKNTPPAIIKKLHAEVVAAVGSGEGREKLESKGYEVHVSTPDEYMQHLQSEIARWSKIVKEAGVTVNQ